jgi:hypothetical protein
LHIQASSPSEGIELSLLVFALSVVFLLLFVLLMLLLTLPLLLVLVLVGREALSRSAWAMMLSKSSAGAPLLFSS